MTEPAHAPHDPAAAPAPGEVRRRRLLYRASHRGTHETDLLIGGFAQARIAGLTAAELDALELLLELPDVDLADWLTGRRPLPAADQLHFRVLPPLGGGGQGEGELLEVALTLLRRMKDAAAP